MHTVTTDEFTGYTFEITEAPNNTGSKITCTAYDKDHNKITEASSCYGNGSGYGYAKMFAIDGCKAQLKELIDNNFQAPKEEPYDTDFLYRLLEEDYITDFGELKGSHELVIMFSSWSQVEGEDEREYVEGEGMVKTGRYIKSVYAKLRELAEKNMLKPSINRTILEVEYVFDDEYMKCYNCGEICHTTWDSIHFIEGNRYEYLCSDCINEDEEAVEILIEEAKDSFRKALPVEIDEAIIEQLGYVKITDEQDFSTRYSQWGEKNYGAFNTPVDIVEDVCKMYDGFAKLTGVWQFDCEYTLYFPSDTVNYARLELGLDTDEDFEDDREEDEEE